MNKFLATCLVLAASLGPLGCRKKVKAVDCGAVGHAYFDLVTSQLKTEQAGAHRQSAEALLPAVRDELVKTCTDNAWTPAAKACVVSAKTIAELEACKPTGVAK